MAWTDYIPGSIKSRAQAGLDALRDARKQRVLTQRVKAQENAEQQVAGTYGEFKLPHDHSTQDRLEAKLGFAVGEETKAKVALQEQDVTAIDTILQTLTNDHSSTSTTRSEILQSKHGAQNLVAIAKNIEDPAKVLQIENIFLLELKSQLPPEAALALEHTDWDIVNTRFASQPEVLRDINIYKALERYFEAKSVYSNSEQANNNERRTNYENAIIDLAELTIDPDSRDVLNTSTVSTSPARSKHQNFLDKMAARKSSYFEKALHSHLSNEGLIEEIDNLRNIIANPIENADHTLVRDPNRSGLRMVLANDILRTTNYRLKSDSIAVGVLGRLTSFASKNNLGTIDISSTDLVDIYGQDNYDRYLSNRTGYTFRLDNFIVDLYAGSTGLNTNNPNDPLINTKAGAVRQLVEVFSVIKLKIDRETNPDAKKVLVRQQELLSTIIKNAADTNSSLVPQGVYQQIQHTLNNETGGVLHSLLPLSQSMKQSSVRQEVLNQKTRLERKHPDARTQQLLANLEYLEPVTGVEDPKAFTTVIKDVVSEQALITTSHAQAILDIATASNATLEATLVHALEADSKGNGLAQLFENATAGQVTKGSVEELLGNIIKNDQRQSRAKFDQENLGTISRFSLSQSQEFDQVRLLRAIKDGDINIQSVQYDESGTERKLVGLAHVFEKIDSSNSSPFVKEKAKTEVLNSLGISSSTPEGNAIITNLIAIDFSQASIGASSFNPKAAVQNINKAEERSLDAIKAFHNVTVADKQSSSLFISSFFKQFTAEGDLDQLQETLTVVKEAFDKTNHLNDFDQRLSQMQAHIRENSDRKGLAESFDVFNFDINQDGQGFGQMVNQLLRHWGFDELAQMITRLLQSIIK